MEIPMGAVRLQSSDCARFSCLFFGGFAEECMQANRVPTSDKTTTDS